MALGYGLTVKGVLAYYGDRPDLITALARTVRCRPLRYTDWEGLDNDLSGEIGTAHGDALTDAIQRRVRDSIPDYLPEDTPIRYPAFHGSIRRDVVLEVDAKHSQRECFARSRPILEFLKGYGAPYRLKFSGNCSAHFIIPEEAYRDLIPEGRWEEASRRFRSWMLEHCGAPIDGSFTDDHHTLRLPYSLNERTGLVSVPIDPERYDTFEPEWAEEQNVRVDWNWFGTDDFAEKREGMLRLLRDALGDI